MSEYSQQCSPEDLPPQFAPCQQAEALALIESCAWGSMHDYICDLEDALRLAMEATFDDYRRWENEFRPALEAFGDELTYPDEVLGEMSDEERRAYVAALIRVLALAYGVNTELGARAGPIIGQERLSSPAALLRGLNDITWMPTIASDEGSCGPVVGQ